jgi:hypothetical protein
LFGFSRGAYTTRCLAAVIAKCGVPTHDCGGGPLKLDVASTQKVARYAVKHVYQFTSSRPASEASFVQRFLLETRELLAKRFRSDYGSADTARPELANVYPYFIGAFDTMAALGSFAKTALLTLAFLIVIALASACLSTLSLLGGIPHIGPLLVHFTFLCIFAVLCGAAFLFLASLFVYTHIKFDFQIRECPWWKRLLTIHPTTIWQRFYDYTLDDHVGYAKHVISIDENRKDFARVPWGKKDGARPSRDTDGNLWFEQVWFSGNHADIGGGYDENESRLSDIALRWMLAWATRVPNGVKYDPSVLNPFPLSAGMQHDECKAGFGLLTRLTGYTWPEQNRILPGEPPFSAVVHRSVYERFDAVDVLQYDTYQRYRPQTLREHADFKDAYSEGVRNPNPTSLAMYVEDGLQSSP